MAFIPVPNCAEVVMAGQMNGHAAYLTLNFSQAGDFSESDLEDLLDIVGNWWDNELSAVVCDDWAMPLLRAVDLSSSTGAFAQKNDMVEPTGQIVTQAVPDNVAMVVTLQTSLRGRSNRGRNYVPGLPYAVLADTSQWTTLSIAAMKETYDALLTALSSTPFSLTVVSRYTNNAPRVVGTHTPVSEIIVRNKIGTQRRRVLGTGA